MADKTTIIEIAKESGVSIATVSRVLNGRVPVSEATRKRVEAVIREHNYSPSALARGLVSRQTMTIGVLLPDISNPYFSSIFSEIERSAHEMGYSTLLCNTLYHSGVSTGIEEDYMQMLLDKQVDGVIIAGGQQDLEKPCQSYLSALNRLASSLPLVMVGNRMEEIPCQFLDRDRPQGVTIAVNHLLSLGHRRIAFLGGEAGIKITSNRLQAYRNALQKAGISIDPGLICLSDYYMKDGYAAASALLSQKPDFTAALAINDSVAQGAIRAFADHGLHIPADISLISCEQFPDAAYLTPRLTSIDQHSEHLGRQIFQTLFLSIQGKTAEAESLAPTLIERDSCRRIYV